MSDTAREQTAQGGGQKLDISVKVYPAQDNSKNLLATATVTLGGCFAIRGLRILDSEKGAFVSMPQRKNAQNEYKDVCFPTTAEMRKELNSAVLGEYQRTMEQSYSRAERPWRNGSPFWTLSARRRLRSSLPHRARQKRRIKESDDGTR